ncbi:tail fiber/spike domain-containing protein [Enterobacter sichuanensis]|uniref:tail fiber/spike domain-containing protein n=1 Tax=Enterobacter sichuanensis TaxID=2071710 RepID=UPI00046FD080
MATQPTNLPVPSESPRDLKFNAGKIDEFVTSLVNTYVDRFGNEHYTIEGLRWLAQQAIAQYGWIPVDSFQDGADITLPNQALRDEATGEYYRWDGALPKHVDAGSTPDTSGGVGPGKWLSIGDSLLRSALLNKVIDGNNKAYGTLYRTLKYFGAAGDGVTDDTAALLAADAYSISSGEPIRVTSGIYKILNANIGGCYVGDNGSIFFGEIGALDNVIIAKSGLRMKNIEVRKKQTAWALHGAYGNCMRIGNYEQPADGSTPVSRVKLDRVVMSAIQTSFTNQGMEILGDVWDVTLTNCKAIGPIGAALIAHWGGDVGTTGDNNNVTYSYHPHGLYIENFRCEKDSAGLFPTTVAIFSACYDVTVDGLFGIGMDRLLDVTPGDVYNEVAVSRDKDKPCTGIRISGAYADSPNPSNTGIPCIRVTGAPQNVRTNKTKYWANDYNAKFDVHVEDVTVAASDVVFSLPLVQVSFCSNTRIEATIIGGGRSSVYPVQTDYNRDCDIKISSATAASAFMRDRGSRDTRFTLDIHRDASLSYSSSDYGLTAQSFISSTFVTNAAAAVGATSIDIRGGSADGIVMAGSIIRNAGGGVIGKLLKTVRIPLGSTNITTVQTTPLTSAIGSALGLTFSLEEEGTAFTGSITGFMRNAMMSNSRGVTFNEMTFGESQRSQVYFSGDCRDIVFNSCRFDGANRSADGVEPWDVTCSVTDTLRRVAFRGCKFEVNNISSVAVGIYFPTPNNAGCAASGNDFGAFTSSAISVAMSGVSAPYNMFSQYDNYAPSGTVLGVGTPSGMYNGSRFVGESGAIPSSGYWKLGDIIRTTLPVASGQEGWICTASGVPGTWKGMGSISA